MPSDHFISSIAFQLSNLFVISQTPLRLLHLLLLLHLPNNKLRLLLLPGPLLLLAQSTDTLKYTVTMAAKMKIDIAGRRNSKPHSQ